VRRLLPILLLAAACGDEPLEPIFPADYRATYVEVRDCRGSGDHDLSPIRVLADPAAMPAYVNRDRPFPVGATLVKEEFEFDDVACEGAIVRWSVMVKLEDQSSPDTLDWRWQRVDGDGTVRTQDEPRCIGCHIDCGVPPDGYGGTCAVP
jgi:hypothetical protein